MSTTPHTARRRMTLTSKVALAAIMLASLTTAATAVEPASTELDTGSVNLHVSVGNTGTRSLELLDLALAPLTDLTLVSGPIPTPYLAVVDDDEYVSGAPFTVYAETGNLYPVTDASGPTVDATGEQIDSGNVSLAMTGPATVTGLLADLLPDLLVTIDGLFDLTGCVGTLEGLPDVSDLLPATGTVTATVIDLPDIEAEVAAVCTALGDLADTLPTPDPVGDDLPLPIEIPLTAIPAFDLDLATLTNLVDILNLTDGSLTPTPFLEPSFEGLGAADAADPANGDPTGPTLVLLMQSTPDLADLTSLVADLLALLPPLPVDVSGVPGGAGAVVAALQADPTTAALGTALGDISDADALTAILNQILNVVNGVIDLSDLTDLIGTYIAAPALTFTVPTGVDAPTPGEYAGTHTVTLVSP